MRAATYGNSHHGRQITFQPSDGISANRSFYIGAVLFGWLVTLSVVLVVTILMVLIGSGLALLITDMGLANVTNNEAAIHLIGTSGVLISFGIAFYAGAYVAGRMSGYKGIVQGIGVWLIGTLTTLLLVAAGASLDSSYHLLQSLHLASLTGPADGLNVTNLATVLAVLIISALLSVVGGKAGVSYHQRIDK